MTKEIIELQPYLMRYAYRLTLDKESADDLLQETTLKALNNIHTFKENNSFKGWTYTIMYHTFINNCNRKNHERNIIEKFSDTRKAEVRCSKVIPGVVNHYDVSKINEAITSLPENYRTTFEMHITGYKYNEIADFMRIPLSKVKNRIHISRKMLQKMLKELK